MTLTRKNIRDIRFVILSNIRVPGIIVEEVTHLDDECHFKIYDKEIREKPEAIYQARKIREGLKDRYPNIIIKVVTV